MLHKACHTQYVTHRLHVVVVLVVVGFFLACKDFGRMFDNSFPACTVFVWGLFVFLIVEISLHTLIPLFRPVSVSSGSAS